MSLGGILMMGEPSVDVVHKRDDALCPLFSQAIRKVTLYVNEWGSKVRGMVCTPLNKLLLKNLHPKILGRTCSWIFAFAKRIFRFLLISLTVKIDVSDT